MRNHDAARRGALFYSFGITYLLPKTLMRICSSDYGSFEAGRYSFYYGYEKTVCRKHTDFASSGGAPLCDDDCPHREWAFTVEIDGEENFRIGSSKLKADKENVAECLLDGIRQFISYRNPKDE